MTDFKTLNVIIDDNQVVINGTADFIHDGKSIAFVSSCDIYKFNDLRELQKITSYCITKKKQE